MCGLSRTTLFAAAILFLIVLVYIKSDLWKRLPTPLLAPKSWYKQPAILTASDSIDRETSLEGFITESDALSDRPITDIKETVSVYSSSVELMDKKAFYEVGDEVQLSITLKNGYNQTRSRGGDQLRVRVFNTSLQAYAAGYVIDHNNGTYTAIIHTFWPGQQTISVILSYRREAVRTLYYIRTKPFYWPKFHGLFKSEQKKDKTLCYPDPIGLTDYTSLCNLTEGNGDMPWFCGKPDTLLCKDLYSIDPNRQPHPVLNDFESDLLSRYLMDPLINIKIQVRGAVATKKSLPQCGTYPAVLSWNRTQPAGFFYKKIWHSDICRSPRFVDYNKCLRNTSLLLVGDSTLRQWYSFLERNFSCSRITEKWTSPTWHKMTMCSKSLKNLKIQWIPHSQPCFGEIWMANGKSVSAVMDAIPNNTQVVLVFGNFNHLIRYHHSVFQIRMRKISNSARRLLQRNPNTKIFIKGPHTYYNKNIADLDYYGYLFSHIIYEEFKDLHEKVIFLDQTDMTIATGQKGIHPHAEVVQASVYQMLNYICSPMKP